MLFVLCGVDAVGKTSICEAMNRKGFTATCRDIAGSPAKTIDAMTLEFPFGDQRAALRESLPRQVNGMECRYIVLTASADTIAKRVSARAAVGRFPDLWETPRALAYYDAAFREIAYECGFPVIPNDTDGLDGVIDRIVTAAACYSMYQSLALVNMDAAAIESLARVDDVHAPVCDPSPLTVELVRLTSYTGINCDEAVRLGHTRAWIAEQVATRGTCDFATYPRLVLVCEGESKRVYRIVTDPRDGPNPYERLCIIVLKNTIYSHSKQSTGEIDGLGRVRAVGSRVNVEIMRRNGISHCYQAINAAGVIMSEYLQPADVLPIEYVYKLACLGTDKHAYYGMTADRRVTNADGSYVTGYCRFDMRNPNHTCGGVAVTDSPCYYPIEAALGKERFFEAVLTHLPPWGDRTLPEPLAAKITDVSRDRAAVSRLFHTLQAYYVHVGIKMLDVCFMKTRGDVFWSEINPDCMRVVRIETAATTDLSKDIWRAGGSGAKELIVEKWSLFNTLMGDWLRANPFDRCEMVDYSVYPVPQARQQRRVMVTLDLYNARPVLVQRGLVTETHSDGDISVAMEKIGIFPDILTVDLNGAFGEDTLVSREAAAALAKRYYVHFGGGLRTVGDVDYMLSQSVRRVTIASKTDLIESIPRDRLVVELSVDENGYVMIDGRRTTTGERFYERVATLAGLGVEAISVTFHHSEGMLTGLPRRQLSSMLLSVPPSIKKIMVAGGIATVDDLHFCWSLDRVIPQLGSAIWKGRLAPGDVYAEMCNYDTDGLVRAIVQDTTGCVLGLVHLNAEAVRKTADSRTLWRYSREHARLMQKGATTDRIMRVCKMALDCDGDAILITVDSPHPTFCHTGNDSCFSQQTVAKASLASLAYHLEARRQGAEPSYSRSMMQNPAWALSKMFEELNEIVSASPGTLMSECADMLIHMLMFLNGRGVTLEDILNELNARRHAPRLVCPAPKPAASHRTILVTAAKYAALTDAFLEKYAGVRVVRGGGRSLKITAEIVDAEKAVAALGTTDICVMGCRPKDMAATIARGLADGAVTYNTVAGNQPPVMKAVVSEPVPTLRLCLIGRKGDATTPSHRKIVIAAEHPVQVSEYLRAKGIPDSAFKIQPILGSSEGYLVNNSEYDLCDAVVETGKTLEDNDLVIRETVLDYGAVAIGFYVPSRA